jgi:integrase
MARVNGRRNRGRGSIEELPSGALRVKVYAGLDAVTKKRRNLTETVPAGKNSAAQAEKLLTRLLNQVDEQRHPRANATVDQLLERHLSMVEAETTTKNVYAGYVNKHVSPVVGHLQIARLTPDIVDSLYASLRTCRERCNGQRFIEHRTPREHECDDRCGPHQCKPLAAASVRHIHWILSGAFKRAVRWRWLAVNPMSQVEPPAPAKPDPQPPSYEQAARIVSAAWNDPDWGTLIWLLMTTGVRRGELCALRWDRISFDDAVLIVRSSIAESGPKRWEKDTKTHQQRRIALDLDTVQVLREHYKRCQDRARLLGVKLAADSFVFSSSPDGSTHLVPSSVSKKYRKLVRRLGLDTHLHQLRHYSATELIAAGVDARTVAGRLGHGGGGATTLRVYSAWVAESDQRAAKALSARMPERPSGDSNTMEDDDG